MRIRRLIPLALSCALCSACHSYETARPEEIPASAEARVTLTLTGVDSLGGAIGVGVTEIEGKIASVTADAVTMRVDLTAGPSSPEKRWNQETVTIPRKFVARVDRAQLSTLRSGLAGVAMLGALVALAEAAGGGHGGGIFGIGSGAGK
jgi:hypothetical protein